MIEGVSEGVCGGGGVPSGLKKSADRAACPAPSKFNTSTVAVKERLLT